MGRAALVGVRRWIGGWPVYRQAVGADASGRGAAVTSKRTEQLRPRVATADKVVKSVCPYCAVGCGQNVYVKDEKAHPDRGRSRLARKQGPLVSEGVGEPPAHHGPGARVRRCSTGARTAPSGSTSTWTRRWT